MIDGGNCLSRFSNGDLVRIYIVLNTCNFLQQNFLIVKQIISLPIPSTFIKIHDNILVEKFYKVGVGIMKGYIFVLNKKRSNVEYAHKISDIFNVFLNKKVNVTEYINGNVSYYTYSNERVSDQYVVYEKFHFGLSGYLTEEETPVFEQLVNSKKRDSMISKLSGVFSLALYDTLSNTFTAWNNITRVEPVYWYESENIIVVGTKAVLVHMVGAGLNKPEYDIEAFTSFLNNGFYCDDSIPFKGVQVLDANSKLCVYDQKIKISPIDDIFSKLYSEEPSHELYDRITEDFLDSFKVIKKHDNKYTMGLTGGKDSRLIIAALNKLGLDVNTHTNGYDDTPDVVVAKEIAKLLGVQHEVKQPSTSTDSYLDLNIYSRTVNSIRNTEGMLYAYENLSGIKTEFNKSKVSLGGQGGELLRGGYAKNRNFTSKEQLYQFLKNVFGKYPDLIKPDAMSKYYGFLSSYIEKQEMSHSNDILNKFFLDFRCGRWSGSSRSAYTMGYYSYAPFFDSKLIRSVSLLQTRFGSSEELIYNILLRLKPELTQLPFANDRWAFEKNNPYSRYDIEGWMRRQPIYSKTKRGAFNWRKDILSNFKDEFYQVIFSNENSSLFDIVDKPKVRSLFDLKGTGHHKYDYFLWSAYTSSILLSNQWYGEIKSRPKARIEVPSLTEQNVNIGKSWIIPSSSVKSASKVVKVEETSSNEVKVSWNNIEQNDKAYFQVFDKSFSRPATSKYNELSRIDGVKELGVHFIILKPTVDNFEIELYVMQFDGKEKVKQQKSSLYITEKETNFSYKVKRHSKAQSFKLAFKIKNCFNPGYFIIDQLLINTK